MADKLKLKAEQAIELLRAAGVQVAGIDDTAEDVDIDELLSTIDQSRTAIIKPALKDELETHYKSHYAGLSAGMVRTAISRVFPNVKKEEIEGMKDTEALEYARSKYDAKYSQDTEALRKEITSLVESHTKSLEETEASWATKLQAEQAKFDERDIDEYLLGAINKLTRTPGDDRFRAEQFKSHLRSLSNPVLDKDQKKVVLRQKENPEAPLLNEKKNKEADIEELAKTFAEKSGWLTTDMRTVNPKDAMDRQQQQQSGLPAKPTGNDGAPKHPVQEKIDMVSDWINAGAQQ